MNPRVLRPGEKVREPGVYSLPLDRYHEQCTDGPSVSSSGLRTILRESPAHFFARSSLNPDRVPEPPSEALLLGGAAHHLLLGEDDFSTQFVERPERFDSWRTNNSKAWKADQEAAGRSVLLPSQLETIRGMARSLARHPLVQAGILNGEIERSFFWQDEATGIWLKSRPDAIPNASGDLADLKTTVSVRTEALERTIADYGYQQQAALIADGYRAILGTDITSFSLVFVEKSPPYCVRVVTLKDDDITRGARQNRAAIKLLRQCLDDDAWPGPGGADAEYLGLPPWEQTRIDNDLALMGA